MYKHIYLRSYISSSPCKDHHREADTMPVLQYHFFDPRLSLRSWTAVPDGWQHDGSAVDLVSWRRNPLTRLFGTLRSRFQGLFWRADANCLQRSICALMFFFQFLSWRFNIFQNFRVEEPSGLQSWAASRAMQVFQTHEQDISCPQHPTTTVLHWPPKARAVNPGSWSAGAAPSRGWVGIKMPLDCVHFRKFGATIHRRNTARHMSLQVRPGCTTIPYRSITQHV